MSILMTITPILLISLPYLLVLLYSWTDKFSGKYIRERSYLPWLPYLFSYIDILYVNSEMSKELALSVICHVSRFYPKKLY